MTCICIRRSMAGGVRRMVGGVELSLVGLAVMGGPQGGGRAVVVVVTLTAEIFSDGHTPAETFTYDDVDEQGNTTYRLRSREVGVPASQVPVTHAETFRQSFAIVLDEAHRGFNTKTPADRTTIVRRLVEGDNVRLPMPIVLGAVAILRWLWLKNTPFGRAIYSIGSDMEAARARGVRTALVRFFVYVVAGGCYGAAGVFISAWTIPLVPIESMLCV